MEVLCDLTTKRILTFSRVDSIAFDAATQIVLTVLVMPDMENDSLNSTNDGITNTPPALTNSERKEAISKIAGKRIKSIVPTTKVKDSKYKLLEREMNLVMLNAELDEKVLTGGTLTTAEQTKKDSFIALKDGIKQIRQMAKTAKTNGDSLDKFKTDLTTAGY